MQESEVPQAVQEAADRMNAKPASRPPATGHDRNQLINRPSASNRASARDAAVQMNRVERGGPLLAEVPQEVSRNRERIALLRSTMSNGVASLDRFLGTAERLITEIETLKGGEDAAKAEGLDTKKLSTAIEDLRKVLDKHCPPQTAS